jgi:hypothetical protein
MIILFYQDGLGTNIGEAALKRDMMRFLAVAAPPPHRCIRLAGEKNSPSPPLHTSSIGSRTKLNAMIYQARLGTNEENLTQTTTHRV